MTVLATAATGNVGGHVVRALLARGVAVRAFVRDPAWAASALGPDVELAVGDFGDPRSLEAAMAGIDRVFLACGNVPDQVAHECAAIDAAAAAGVARVVKLSGPDAALDSPLVFERWHAQIEEQLLAAGLDWVILRPRTYLTNLLASAPAVAQSGMLFAPAGEAKISFIDPRDVADVAAAVLVENGHAGRVYTLTGPEAITHQRIVEELSAATGRAITYVDVPDEAARRGLLDAGLPPMMADAVVAIFASQRAGSMVAFTDTVREITGRAPRTVGDFLRENARLFQPAELAESAGAAAAR